MLGHVYCCYCIELLREHSRQQAERFADISEKLAELTRNSQVLLKQEQDKTAYLLPDETQGSSDSSGEGEGKKRGVLAVLEEVTRSLVLTLKKLSC